MVDKGKFVADNPLPRVSAMDDDEPLINDMNAARESLIQVRYATDLLQKSHFFGAIGGHDLENGYGLPLEAPRISAARSETWLPNLCTLVVQSPFDCPTDSGRIRLHLLTRSVHPSTKTIKHDISIITGLLLESIEDPVYKKLFQPSINI